MARFTTVADLAVDDALPESWVDAVRGAVNYMTIAGATLSALGGSNTLTVTAEYHAVSVAAGNVDNIADASGAVAGQRARLLFTNAQTIRDNAPGNIRTLNGSNYSAQAGELVVFQYDGANWHVGATSVGITSYVDSQLVADAANWDFQNIVAGVLLEGLFNARGATAAQDVALAARLNNDSGATYDHQRLRARSTTVDTTATLAGTSFQMGDIPAASSAASASGVIQLLIGNYANTALHKGMNAHTGMSKEAAGEIYAEQFGGAWRSTAAVTRLTVLCVVGNILSGSRATLYVRN